MSRKRSACRASIPMSGMGAARSAVQEGKTGNVRTRWRARRAPRGRRPRRVAGRVPRAGPRPIPGPGPRPAAPRRAAGARAEEPKGAAAAAARPTPQGWSQAHLLDSWLDEQRLKGWTPSDQDLQEMVEDNIEADPQVPGRDRRAISVRAQGSTVTLT